MISNSHAFVRKSFEREEMVSPGDRPVLEYCSSRDTGGVVQSPELLTVVSIVDKENYY